MSRIREALKKAAEQRSAQVASRTAEDLVEILRGGPLQEASVSAQVLVEESAPPQRVEGGRTEFDSLVANCRRVQWHVEPRFSFFADERNNRAGAERFRTLRSRLHQIAAAQPLRRILLTSSAPVEGKTFVASNLAQSIIRQSDRKVLLIDADLRASRLHLTLGTHDEPGLSDYLRGITDITKVIQVGELDNLCFIPGGREVSNPSELLHSEKMKSL